MAATLPLYSIDTHGELNPHLEQEWLLTNGLGGYAQGTVVGCNTRRYHGLLCAATLPPVGRRMLLNRVGEILRFDGQAEPMRELSINQFGDQFHPRGDLYLRHFQLDDTARWEYQVEGVTVIKELQMLWLQNAIALRYTITPDRARAVELQILPFVSLRDFHSLLHAGASFETHVAERRVTVQREGVALHLRADAGQIEQGGDWWYGHTYRAETRRGLDDHEDLFCPARLSFQTSEPATITLWASLGEMAEEGGWEDQLERRREAVGAARRTAENVRPNHPAPVDAAPRTATITRLLRAANDFVVYRKTPDGHDGTSIIAGYPWFADWGRDTMIALPGLLLATCRFEEARQVLSVFASYVSEGMIPNRFDDYTNEPHYNTVDASLWFVHAAHEYARLANDRHTFDSVLLPACRAIIDGYRRGTRFGIQMDPADGLITQGDANTQLTWMDAKCDGIAFTPRQGKPVEINALWYHALVLLNENDLAAKVAESFRKVFWISPFRGLCDVVNDGQRDTSIRPNQIFAVSLPHSALSREQQQAVVEVVRRELLTPYGLRTLAPGDPKYHPRFTGPQRQRDEAYHNGTVWPWPMGAFLDSYLRVNDNAPDAIEQAKQWLMPLLDHMERQACIGQISEVFDADEPHRPGGCCAQAWSVAEVLRLALKLGM
jgi:predicted glycogen debranching enzyme